MEPPPPDVERTFEMLSEGSEGSEGQVVEALKAIEAMCDSHWGENDLPSPSLKPVLKELTLARCEVLVSSFKSLPVTHRVYWTKALNALSAYPALRCDLVSAGAGETMAGVISDGVSDAKSDVIRYACHAAGRLALTCPEQMHLAGGTLGIFNGAVRLLASPLPDVAQAACYLTYALIDSSGVRDHEELREKLLDALLKCLQRHGDRVAELVLKSLWRTSTSATLSWPLFANVVWRRASSAGEAVASCRLMTLADGPGYSEKLCKLVLRHLRVFEGVDVVTSALHAIRVLSNKSESNRVELSNAFLLNKEAYKATDRYMRTDEAVAEAATGALCEQTQFIQSADYTSKERWVFKVVAAMWIFGERNINVMVYGCRFIKLLTSHHPPPDPATANPNAHKDILDILGKMGACEVVLNFMASSPVKDHALICVETIDALAEGHVTNQRRVREAGAAGVLRDCLNQGLLVTGDATWPWLSTDGPVAASVRRTERLCSVSVRDLEKERGSRASEREWWGIGTCIVCRDRAATQRVLPCRCDNLCKQCVHVGAKCPTCRGEISGSEALPTLNTVRDLACLFGKVPPPAAAPAAAPGDAVASAVACGSAAAADDDVEVVAVLRAGPGEAPPSPGSYEPSDQESEDLHLESIIDYYSNDEGFYGPHGAQVLLD